MNQLTTDIVSIANTLRVRPKLSRSLRAKMYRACIPGVIKNSQASNPEKHIVPYKKKSTCAQENLSAHLILELLNKLSLLLLLAAFRSVFHKLKEKTYYGFIDVGNHNVGIYPVTKSFIIPASLYLQWSWCLQLYHQSCFHCFEQLVCTQTALVQRFPISM